MKKIINDVKRVNLTLDHEFYAFIKAKADADFIKLGTWLKQYLKQNIKKILQITEAMGYDVRTNLLCTNPTIIFSGSTFSQKWAKSLMEIDKGVFKYCSRGYSLHDDLVDLSKQYPNESFTGITWEDSNIYNRIKYTLIFKNGGCKQVNCEPGYVYGFYNDNYYEMPTDLFERFKKHLDRYIERIDIVRENIEEGVVFDFLNNNPDEDGFMSYYTITWENDEHKFTATRRFTSEIAIKYEKKQSSANKRQEIEKELKESNEDYSTDDLPF